MNMHGISEAEWIAYIDEQMDEPARIRIQEHLRDCAACQRIVSELLYSQGLLVEQTDRFVREFEITPADVARIVSAGMTRIRSAPEATGPEGYGIEGWVGQLRSTLTPICGSTMADISMKLAAYDAANSSVDALKEIHWGEFVSHLSTNVASLCGCAAGSLIARTGAQLVEAAA